MTLAEALEVIAAAGNRHAAQNVRNALGMESQRGLRPWSDVAACEAAIRERFGDAPRDVVVAIDTPRQGGNWVGG